MSDSQSSDYQNYQPTILDKSHQQLIRTQFSFEQAMRTAPYRYSPTKFLTPYTPIRNHKFIEYSAVLLVQGMSCVKYFLDSQSIIRLSQNSCLSLQCIQAAYTLIVSKRLYLDMGINANGIHIVIQKANSDQIQKQLEGMIALRKLIYTQYRDIFLMVLQSGKLAKIFQFTKQHKSPQILLETYRIIFLVAFFRHLEEKPFIRQAFDLLVDGLDSKHKPILQASLTGLLMITTSCHDYNKQLIEKGYVLEKVVGLIDTCEDKKMKKICLTIVTNICKEQAIGNAPLFTQITKIFANTILEYKFPTIKYCSVPFEILQTFRATLSLCNDASRKQLVVSKGIIPKLMDCANYTFIIQDALNFLAIIMNEPRKYGKEIIEAGLIDCIERILINQGNKFPIPIFQMLANLADVDSELIKPLLQKEQTMEYIFQLSKSTDQQKGILQYPNN